MSICRGIAGRRGKNPVGIFIHNGADGQNATIRVLQKLLTKTQTWKTDLLTTMCVTMEFCKQRMILTVLGIAGIQTEIVNFLGVEVCQSMGDSGYL